MLQDLLFELNTTITITINIINIVISVAVHVLVCVTTNNAAALFQGFHALNWLNLQQSASGIHERQCVSCQRRLDVKLPTAAAAVELEVVSTGAAAGVAAGLLLGTVKSESTVLPQSTGRLAQPSGRQEPLLADRTKHKVDRFYTGAVQRGVRSFRLPWPAGRRAAAADRDQWRLAHSESISLSQTLRLADVWQREA